MHPGTGDLGAAVLLMARTAFCRDEQRLHSAIDAISRELAATGPLLGNFPHGLSHLALIGAARALQGGFRA